MIALFTSLITIDSSFDDAHAVSRHDIKNIKIKIYAAQDDLKSLEANALNQKKTVSEKEDIVIQKIKILKDLKKIDDDSLKHDTKIINAEKEIIHAEAEAKKANKTYFVYLDEQSEKTRLIESLELALNNSEDLLMSQGANNNVIGIELSQTCITLIKNNLDSSCPTYEELSQIDGSNYQVSGKFVIDDDSGFFHRETPTIKNSHQWYKQGSDLVLIVDPPSGYNLSTITIMPHLDTYIMKGSHAISENNLRTLFHDRYIDNCNSAKINAGDWKSLLPDTLYHMSMGCTDSSTTYDEFEEIFDPPTEFDITQSPNYQYHQWVESSKELCKIKC